MLLAVTTPCGPDAAAEAEAREAAERHGFAYAPRGRHSLAAVAAGAGAQALLVLSPARAALWLEGSLHPWHPGMGILRARRLRGGERSTADTLLGAAGLSPGEAVLDCTLGLGADALVAAVAVGPGGQVVGLESSAALAALAAEGFRRLADGASGRIEVRRAEALQALSALPSRSFDLVLFDPMFRHARAEPPGFDLVRRLGDARPLAPEALREARRVARRAVLVKDGTPGWDLARLGLTPLPSARGAHRLYARIDVG